ncbi:SpoIIE family protein phosphatase [Nonomuraea sp. NN258]|uniref:PP2C family protein-serine/threonine phosphatase n=1 Tax=Nonomuraea antri TaxID=2730852 RepID=UPI00156A2702|nr:SpoIIE family protein phosphatase [Nonomuraea antri]NRQ38752.1 SpoIIE family protein phosphatase [Nonomuraea antri]
MTLLVITFLISCLSVMAARGKRGIWPAGMPVARPRLVAAGGTYEGTRGHPSDTYVVQERLIAAAGGTNGTPHGHSAAALALSAVIAARPQYGKTREQDLDACAQAAHRAVRRAALRTPAVSGLVSTLDLIILDRGESPCLRFAHVGDGAIWHCSRGRPPRLLTSPHSLDNGPLLRGIGLASTLTPELGMVPLRPGDRVVLVTAGVTRALGEDRLAELLTLGASPAACLDRLYDELAAAEPKDDATAVIADVVTA